MYGYIRPCLPELKIKDYNRFRASYCGLCHELKRGYGPVARFILNYEFIFLSMILTEDSSTPSYEMRRCPYAPWCKKCVCGYSSILRKCAGYSIILAYWKLCDSINDEKFIKRFLAVVYRLFLKHPYKRAVKEYPKFDENVRKLLGEQREMELRGEKSLDMVADKFGTLLSCAVGDGVDSRSRVCRQILYHLGRIIYLADAFDDLAEDNRAGRYNPISAHFSISDGVPTDEIIQSVRLTMYASLDIIYCDYDLLKANYWDSILKNVLYISIPKMIDDVLAGKYDPKGKRLKEQLKSLKQNSLQEEA